MLVPRVVDHDGLNCLYWPLLDRSNVISALQSSKVMMGDGGAPTQPLSLKRSRGSRDGSGWDDYARLHETLLVAKQLTVT